jgi:hypothetical protein
MAEHFSYVSFSAEAHRRCEIKTANNHVECQIKRELHYYQSGQQHASDQPRYVLLPARCTLVNKLGNSLGVYFISPAAHSASAIAACVCC